VTRLGTLIRRYPAAAALLLAATLLLHVLIPAGFMPAIARGQVTLAICTGFAPASAAPHHGGHDMGHSEQTQPQSPCAFADLALPTLASPPPLLLAEALAFVALLALLLAAAATPRAPVRLRPPLRGPPTLA